MGGRLLLVGGGHAHMMALAGFSDRIRKRARKSLSQRGIKILEGERVTGIKDGGVLLNSDETKGFEFIFLALGVIPNAIFIESFQRSLYTDCEI